MNHVAAETAQEAQDVVFGMFLVHSAPALVLFDSGHRIPLFPLSLLQNMVFPCILCQNTC